MSRGPISYVTWAICFSFFRFLDHTQRRTTFVWTPLEEGSARRRILYLYNTQPSQETDIHAPRRDSNPQSQKPSDRSPTP